MNLYYIIKADGTQAGPMSVADVQEMLARGEITTDSLAATPGAQNWVKVSDILLSNNVAPSIPSVPASWDIFKAFTSCIKRYTKFSGRASRSEYWFFALAYLILYIFALVIDVFLFLGLPVCQLLLTVALLIPSLAVSWRRMHDSGLCGAHTLWGLIPYLGSVVIIILACRASDAPNQYGNAPDGPAQ